MLIIWPCGIYFYCNNKPCTSLVMTGIFRMELATTESCTGRRARFGLDFLALRVGSRGAVPHELFILFTPSSQGGKKTDLKHEGIKMSEAIFGAYSN